MEAVAQLAVHRWPRPLVLAAVAVACLLVEQRVRPRLLLQQQLRLQQRIGMHKHASQCGGGSSSSSGCACSGASGRTPAPDSACLKVGGGLLSRAAPWTAQNVCAPTWWALPDRAALKAAGHLSAGAGFSAWPCADTRKEA
eukprot:358186-Chlamydomonas_euryale.AAC.1